MTCDKTPQCPKPCGLCPERRPIPAGNEYGERAEFEAWAKKRAHPFHDREPLLNHGAIDRYSDIAWQAWQARAALASSVAGGVDVPAGYKLVPVEPTPEMLVAGAACRTTRDLDEDDTLGPEYRAMLAAAHTMTESPIYAAHAVRAGRLPLCLEGLHPATADLVRRFAAALAEKLAAAEKKYGYSDGWADPAWMDECRQKLMEHIAKGDPRDVAAYCAFLWHHGESTARPPVQESTR